MKPSPPPPLTIDAVWHLFGGVHAGLDESSARPGHSHVNHRHVRAPVSMDAQWHACGFVPQPPRPLFGAVRCPVGLVGREKSLVEGVLREIEERVQVEHCGDIFASLFQATKRVCLSCLCAAIGAGTGMVGPRALPLLDCGHGEIVRDPLNGVIGERTSCVVGVEKHGHSVP